MRYVDRRWSACKFECPLESFKQCACSVVARLDWSCWYVGRCVGRWRIASLQFAANLSPLKEVDFMVGMKLNDRLFPITRATETKFEATNLALAGLRADF